MDAEPAPGRPAGSVAQRDHDAFGAAPHGMHTEADQARAILLSEARIEQLQALDAPPKEQRRQLRGDGFNLG